MMTAAATCRRRHGRLSPFLLLLLLPFFQSTAAQLSPPGQPPVPWRGNFNPGMAIIVVVLISAFFFMAFFSIYIRNRRERAELQRLTAAGGAGGAARARGGAARGLDAAAIETLPTFVYSEVKEHKMGKGALECAVCLCEFEDDDKLRLLTKCDHVFHSDCIDAWFSAHTTCPVCRTNLAPDAGGGGEAGSAVAPVERPEEVVITVNDGEAVPATERTEEEELPPLPPGRQRRRIPRSHSTGHSVQLAEDRERYTLRLPETIRREVVAGKFRRSASCLVPGAEGGSATKNRMSGGGRSSFKMRKWDWSIGSDRWASFKRTFSMKISRGDDAGPSGAAAAAAVGRTSFKVKVIPNAANLEEGSVNVRAGADR